MTNPNDKHDEVKIKQINPRTELNDLEKTAIMQFKIERQEELSKTKQFKLLNRGKKINSKVALPKIKDKNELPKLKTKDIYPASSEDDISLPKLKPSLFETVKIKISNLSDNFKDKEKTNIYETVILKLDEIINKKKTLNKKNARKVIKTEEPKITLSKKYFKRKHLNNNIKINVDSEEFGKELYNLNKLALTNLINNSNNKIKTRKYSNLYKLNKIDKIHISKNNFTQYQQQLNKFAINKLYYKLAPKESTKYKIYKYSIIVSSIILFTTSLIIINWAYQGYSIKNISNKLQDQAEIKKIEDGTIINTEKPKDPNNTSMYWKYLHTPLSSVNFTKLIEENEDTVGWIIINNTNVNYPVVQTTNNDYYLTHAFDKSTNDAGWIYADFRDDFTNFNKNIVIYGHGRVDKVMFGSLTNTLDKEWYTNKDNQIIQLSTLKYNTMWQIFSIYKNNAESYYIQTNFSSNETFEKFLKTMQERSIYNFNVDLTKNDKILTLSTCYNNNGVRLVIQAKLVKIQER